MITATAAITQARLLLKCMSIHTWFLHTHLDHTGYIQVPHRVIAQGAERKRAGWATLYSGWGWQWTDNGGRLLYLMRSTLEPRMS